MPSVVIPKLENFGNFKLENFGLPELAAARAAVTEVKDLCNLIDRAITPVNLAGTKVVVRGALADWFGVTEDTGYRRIKDKLMQLNRAQTTGNVTLVYRPDITVKDAAGAPALLGDGTAFKGENVFGYVHHQQAGSGYRVVCGKLFITDHTPYFASTTIYHEMSHKVLKTADHGYGPDLCKTFAHDHRGISNADNYAYFAIAIGNARAKL